MKKYMTLLDWNKKFSYFVICAIFLFSTLGTSLNTAQGAFYSFSQFSPQGGSSNLVSSLDLVAQEDEAAKKLPAPKQAPTQESGPVINFNNVQITEFLRFVSRITGKNFVFDPNDLQFTVTIISESPASLDEIMAILLQNLRAHDFVLQEDGTSFLIYRNKDIKGPAGLFKGKEGEQLEPQIATQVFLIEYVDPARVASIVKNMVSKDALVDLIPDSRRLIVTDVASNIVKIAELLTALDSPKSGLEIGQYVCVNNPPTSLASIAERFLRPVLTQGQIFHLIPNAAANSVFVISSPFLVEKALSIMQTMDLGESISRILSLDDLKFDEELARKMAEDKKKMLTPDEISKLTEDEIYRILREKGFTDAEIRAMTKEQIQRYLRALQLGPEGEAILAGMRKSTLYESPLPIGQVESTQFYIYKLQYRAAPDVVKALRSIAASLRSASEKGIPQTDLIITLESLQIIEENNSIVLTGTSATVEKAKSLIAEIDIPVRQVMIEVLILDTTLANSLNFGVDSAFKYQSRNFSIEGGFFGSGFTNVIGALGTVTGVPVPPPPPLPGSTIPFDLTPDIVLGTPSITSGQSTAFGTTPPAPGFATGTIGRKIIHHGRAFLAFAALINAVRTDQEAHIIMNPKITTEHNVPAEIFVGQEVGLKGQSVANNNGNILTTNYETRQTGLDLKVTPLISSGDMITLIIEQTISNVSQQAINAQASANAPPATINETRTVTRVHLPSEHFIVLSGMVTEERDYNGTALPCLGTLPLVGGLFSQNSNTQNKRNLLLFLRPYIIDNDVDIDDIAKRQQDLYDEKSKSMRIQRGVFDDIKTILNLDNYIN